MMRRGGAVAVLLAAMMAGCVSDLLGPDKVDYGSAKKLPPLDIPPDLTAPGSDDRYQIPDVASSSAATYSAYSAERTGAPSQRSTEVLPNVDGVHLERAGDERWLVVAQPPEKVWPVVKEFWQESGFLLKTENPQIGIMETDWADNRAKIPQDGIRGIIGKVFDSAYSTSERDMFRTRLERGEKPDTTEIYITHRGVEEVFISENRDDTRWQPRPRDPSLEAEFLQKLMVRFGVQESRAKTQLAKPKEDDSRAKITGGTDGAGRLELSEPFDRAWRRVGLALDRGGFTVEDRDRSKGFYFVRYVDSDAEALKKDESFFSKLAFWRPSEKGISEQYRIVVKDRNNESSEVQVLDKEGKPEHSDTARKILALLQNQLK